MCLCHPFCLKKKKDLKIFLKKSQDAKFASKTVSRCIGYNSPPLLGKSWFSFSVSEVGRLHVRKYNKKGDLLPGAKKEEEFLSELIDPSIGD